MKLQIDARKRVRVDQRPVEVAVGVVDLEPAAERIQARLGAGELTARDHQRVDGTVRGQELLGAEAVQLRVQERHVERRAL